MPLIAASNNSTNSHPRFTIVVCCYNGAVRLPRLEAALHALLGMDASTVEMVFVDNCSTDGTRSELVRIIDNLPVPARVFSEPCPGLMHARTKGVLEARGEWIVCFDDDNEPRADYLITLAALVAKYPKSLIFTGNSLLPSDYVLDEGWKGISAWLALRNLRGEVEFVPDETASPYFPIGAGMVVRAKNMAEACRYWTQHGSGIVGRQGDIASGGEDFWLAHFVTREGGSVVFSDRLELVHRIEPHRLTARYARALGYQSGLDFLRTWEAIRAIKPWVNDKQYRGVIGTSRAVIELFAWGTRFFLRPDVEALAKFSIRCGLVQELFLRRLQP